MSKIVEQRYEYVCADTASLANTPPTYPAPLDVYQAGYTGSVADAYGIVPIASSGSAVALGVPAGASCLIVGDPTNTAPIVLTQSAVPKTPGAAPQALWWPVMPSQLVTLPGVLNLGNLVVQGVTTAGVATTSTPFAAQLMWML